MPCSGQDTFLLDVLGSPWLGPWRNLFVMLRLMIENVGPDWDTYCPVSGGL